MRFPTFTAILVLSVAVREGECITRGDLFPFGPPAGDERLPADAEDISSQETALQTYVKFFGREYGAIYVNENGLLSFLTEIPSFFNVQFPLDYPLIAALYSDVDCRAGGTVWYRATDDALLLGRARDQIVAAFPGYKGDFSPTELFVATWDRVGYYDKKGDKVNTFQVVVASDELNSFVIFLYPSNGIQWIKAQGKNRNMPDARAQAGIISGEGRYFTLKGSGTDQIQRLDQWSNANRQGVWMFRIGALGADGNVEQPTLHLGPEFSPETASSCQIGASWCHSAGVCEDQNNGFCCACSPGWYGNGLTCLPNGLPQRVNGKVSGTINGVSFTQQDLHCYVVTEDGRTYTAISRVAPEIGFDLRALTAIGSPIAWLFAQSLQGAENGFTVTGGVFNYTAEVLFPNTRHRSTIKFHFKGLDAFDYLKVTGSIRGSLPPLAPQGAELVAEDYAEEYSKIRPGYITSSAKRELKIMGTNDRIPLEVSHVIEYEACDAETIDPATRTTRFKSSRNYIVYDDEEQVVRYAMTSQVLPLGPEEDPCREFDCGSQSYCQADSAGQARCVCNPGFRKDADRGCLDIDECLEGAHDCSLNAECVNQQGSFGCICKEGFVGDGVTCLEELTCTKLSCHDNAECLFDRLGQPYCACSAGFEGDGQVECTVIPSEVKLSGYAVPEELVFDNVNPEGSDPDIQHAFEVINLGVGTVRLHVHGVWPMADVNDNMLAPLRRRPYVKYAGTENGYLEDCTFDKEKYPDLDDTFSVRVKRQDYIYDENLTVLSPVDYELTEYDKELLDEYSNLDESDLSDYEKALLQQYSTDDVDYDYSKFDVYNDPDESPMMNPVAVNMPEAERVEAEIESEPHEIGSEPPKGANASSIVETKRQRQAGPGQFEFQCRVTLGPNEAAVVTVPARFSRQQFIDLYANVGRFLLPSEVTLAKSEEVRIVGPDFVKVRSWAVPSDATVSQKPGEGAECGSSQCHKYAECVQAFDGTANQECRCLPGFKGDGMECTPSETNEAMDCRQTFNCHTDASCLYSEETQIFQCQCNEGYEGDGMNCKIPMASCLERNTCSPNAFCGPDSNGEYVCQCRAGYYGDGLTCRPNKQPSPHPSSPNPGSSGSDSSGIVSGHCNPQGNCECPQGYEWNANSYICEERSSPVENQVPEHCTSDSECNLNAKCIFDSDYTSIRCICNEFYQGDGYNCEPGPDAGCSIKKDCDTNADCVDDVCLCKEGFTGDGYFCKENVIGCNIIDNCGRHAFCEMDFEEGGYRCKCDRARGFDGDGFVCRPAEPCNVNPNQCDPHAECVPQAGGPRCVCREGYLGDGYSLIPKYDGNYLLLSHGMAIVKVPFDATETNKANPILIESQQMATGIDIDCLKGKMYWTDTTGRMIRSASFEGSNRQVVINRNLEFPTGVAIDWVARLIFWTDSGKRTVEVASLDDISRRRVLVDEMIRNPRGIAVHPSLGKLFWSDWDRAAPRIETSAMDGSGRIILVDNMLGMPNALAVDHERYQLCWTDAGAPRMPNRPSVDAKIECMNINGGGRRPLMYLEAGQVPYGLALTDNSLFYTDWARPGVHAADRSRDTGRPLPRLAHVLERMGKSFGVIAVPDECPPATSACVAGASACPDPVQHLCLPNGRGGGSCLCGKNETATCNDVLF